VSVLPIANTDHRTTEHSTSDNPGDISWVQKAAMQLYRTNVPLLHKSIARDSHCTTSTGVRRPGYETKCCSHCLLTLGAHAQQRLLYLVCVSVCLSVCLSPLILALHGPSWLISDINGSSATRARKVMWWFAWTAVFKRYGVKTGDKATYLHGPLPIQAQWNIGSFMMERRECSNDNSVSASLWSGCTVGSS